MIIYALICESGHQFEGWFQDHDSFLDQLEKGLIQCPTCGSHSVAQHLSTGGIVRSRQESLQAPSNDGEEERKISHGEFFRVLRETLETHFEDVGTDFAKTALKMHYGAEEKRNIRGTTTEEEERILKEEGVAFFKVPLPVKEEDSEYN